MSRITAFWGEFSFTKKDFRLFIGYLGFWFKKYLKNFFIADFITGFFVNAIFLLTIVIKGVYLIDNFVEYEFYTVSIAQFSSYIIFMFPILFVFNTSSKILNTLFDNLDSYSRDFVFTYKLAFSVCIIFLRIFFVTTILLTMVWCSCLIFKPFVFNNTNLLSIIIYCLLGIAFWISFSISCFYVIPEKYKVLFVQITMLVFIASGGLVFTIDSLPSQFDILSQIVPTRSIGDILLYNFLGSKVPGGAVVTFFEFFVIFSCLFILVLGKCRNNKRVLFI